ncbi:MAG: type II secretion system protein GspL [Pseudomonadota bacterium]
MQKILIKTTRDPFIFQWMKVPSDGAPASASAVRDVGTLAELKADLEEAGISTHLVFLAPALSVHVRQLSFEPAEKKHLAKTVPFTLEDEMICDASDLHCVMTKPQDNRIWVAAVQRNDLNRWLMRFEEAGLTLRECYPEQAVLLDESNHWSMYYDNNEYLIRCGEPQVHGVDSNNIGLALELATRGYENIPPVITLTVNEAADRDDALIHIPNELYSYLETDVTPLPTLFDKRVGNYSALNLLQGPYSRSGDLLASLGKWKRMLAFFLFGLLVHVGVSYAEYRQSNAELKEVRGDIKTLYQKVFPDGKAKNARKKIASELKRYKGGDASSMGFLELLSVTSNVVQKRPEFELKSLMYDGKNGIELDVFLKDQSSVETLKSELQSKDLDVTLLNSTGQGDQVRARMKIKSKS